MATVALSRALSRRDYALARDLGRRAAEAGYALWLVGGPVRDAMLGRRVVDLDVAAEAPIEELGAALGLETQSPTRFGTAKAQVGGRTLDLAMARTEVYPRPGALPVVAPGSMTDDLGRRDFTVNAMAAALSPQSFGTLLDPYGGTADLERRVLRGLHAATFRDDATRMLRAARYAARLRLTLHPATRRWLARSLDAMAAISPARVHRELRRTVEEAQGDGARALLLARRLGVLGAIHPALASDAVADALRAAGQRGVKGDTLLAVLTVGGDLEEAARRTGLTKQEAENARWLRWLLDDDAIAAPRLPPSHVAEAIGGAPDAAIEAAMALRSTEARRNLRRYLDRRYAKPRMRGEDLMAMGVPEGPEIGRLLDALAPVVLDGRARTLRAERSIVRRMLEEAK